MPDEIAPRAGLSPMSASGGKRRVRRLCAAAVAGITLGWAGQAFAAVLNEYQAKAAYLANFAPFVTWPEDKLPPGAPLVLCMLGSDPFGSVLDIAGAQMVGDHRMTTKRISRADEGGDCHILYVRRADSLSVAEALAAVRGAPVLTVTDSADGPGPKGMLNFVVIRSRVRFQFDPAPAAQARLVISSKLQRLALPSRAGP